MRTPLPSLTLWLLAAAAFVLSPNRAWAEPTGWRDVVLRFESTDGVPLEAKLSLPEDATGPVPVVFYLHGAGPRTYDNPYGYRDNEGDRHMGRYLDFHAGELTRRGLGFFRMNKRGCVPQDDPPWMTVDREIFSGATIETMLGDYNAALDALRERPEVDASRIVFMGSSEGTRVGPLLAKRSPGGVIGVAMMGYAADNARDTVVWQMSVGAWRDMQHIFEDARDGSLTRAEYDAALERGVDGYIASPPFEVLDRDGDGVLTGEDFSALVRPHLDSILKAVDERNDDLLWAGLMNLSSAYLLEWWDAPPNSENLLALDIPLAIFHGALDGTTRVEGVYETRDAFRKAGRTNLRVCVYDHADHDLNWTWRNAREGGPPAYRDAFDWIASRAFPDGAPASGGRR